MEAGKDALHTRTGRHHDAPAVPFEMTTYLYDAAGRLAQARVEASEDPGDEAGQWQVREIDAAADRRILRDEARTVARAWVLGARRVAGRDINVLGTLRPEDLALPLYWTTKELPLPAAGAAAGAP